MDQSRFMASMLPRGDLPSGRGDIPSSGTGERSAQVAERVMGTARGRGNGEGTDGQRDGGLGGSSPARSIPGTGDGSQGGDGGGDKEGTGSAGAGDRPEDPIGEVKQQVQRASDELKKLAEDGTSELKGLTERAILEVEQRAASRVKDLDAWIENHVSALLKRVEEIRTQAAEVKHEQFQRILPARLTRDRLMAGLQQVEEEIHIFIFEKAYKSTSNVNDARDEHIQGLQQARNKHIVTLENTEAGALTGLDASGRWITYRLREGLLTPAQALENLDRAIKLGRGRIEQTHQTAVEDLKIKATIALGGIQAEVSATEKKVEGQFGLGRAHADLVELESFYGRAWQNS